MSESTREHAPAPAALTTDNVPKGTSVSSTTNTDAEADLTPSITASPTSTAGDTSKLEQEDTFYAGALKRTGTLYEGVKEGALKRSGTVSQAVSGGLKRTGTLMESAKEGFMQRTAGIRESAGQGLQRTGTVLESYRQGLMNRTASISESANASPTLQRSGTILQHARENAGAGLQRTGTILAHAADGAKQRASSFSVWAQDYAKGIYDPDKPFRATFQEVAGFALARSGHSISVINGRAYIFGGEDGEGAMADNHMHVVILPSGGVLEADYKSVAPRSSQKNGELPASRKGHTAVVVGDEIYIYGGRLAEKAKEETAGRVWVFDTISAKWTPHDPKSDAPYPPPRTEHAATSSELPGPVHPGTNAMDLQRTYLSPSLQAKTHEPSPSDSWGTMFIYGGIDPASPDTLLNDAWAYDICHHAWFPLPPPPAPARLGASLILADDALLYRVGGRTDPEHILETDFLNVRQLLKTEFRHRLSLPSMLREWTTLNVSAPLLGPTVRLMHPGDGRNILLSIQPGAKTVTAVDISPEEDSGWLPTIAGTRLELVGEEDTIKPPKPVQAVQVQYADPYGEVIRGPMAGRRQFAQASAWACERGTEVEEAGLIVWGGKDATGKTLGSGWMINLSQ